MTSCIIVGFRYWDYLPNLFIKKIAFENLYCDLSLSQFRIVVARLSYRYGYILQTIYNIKCIIRIESKGSSELIIEEQMRLRKET